jgi:hypothetical protein
VRRGLNSGGRGASSGPGGGRGSGLRGTGDRRGDDGAGMEVVEEWARRRRGNDSSQG